MSPEQKLLFLYLHTNPYASACGIYKMQVRTMSFQIGLTGSPFESALRGLASAFPDFIAIDWQTNEVALLQYPKQLLITASKRVMAHVEKEIEKIESQYLLRELIARNSSTLSKPYLSQLRRLQAGVINMARFNGDVAQVVDIQEDDRKKEKENKKERKEKEISSPAPLPEYHSTMHQRDVKAVIGNPNAAVNAEKRFKTLAALRGIEYQAQYLTPYFLNQQQRGNWHDLAEPANEGDAHIWIAKHAAGLQAWALRQPQFERKASGQTPDQPAKAGFSLPK